MKPVMKLILGLGLLTHASVISVGSATAEDLTLNALYMKQAAYSEDDIRAMTTAFEKGNPGVHVNLEFVPYEALHDKIVAAQGAGSSGMMLSCSTSSGQPSLARRDFCRMSPRAFPPISMTRSMTAPGPPLTMMASAGACPGFWTPSIFSITWTC